MAFFKYWPETYACLFVDITWRRLFSAYVNLISNLDRKRLQKQVEDLFGGASKAIVCTSVRSGLDLFLASMNFPKGSEIIFTAINIPDMQTIVESHGINIVTVDIDLETLGPKEELLELAITENTVAILVAHIYGKWLEMDKIIDIAHSRGIFVIEDCAESFQGLKKKGHESSDIVFFSFGLIKHSTCLGGAIVNVKNAELLKKMRVKLESYPIQSHKLLLNKLLKYSILTLMLNASTFQWVIIRLSRILSMSGYDYKEWFISFLRGYPGQILPQLRLQPSAALLKIMFDVLSNVNEQGFNIVKMKGDFVGQNLPENVFIPGKKAHTVNYWLFPIVVDNPYEVMNALAKEGVEAYQGATQLRTIYKTIVSKETTQKSSSEESSEERFAKTLLPSQGLCTTNEFSTSPEVAAGVSQSFSSPNYGKTFLTSKVAQHSLSAADSEASYTSSAFYVEKDEQLQDDITQNAKGTKRNSKDILYPFNAEYLIDHVLYLPVHKRVPLWYLEYICIAVEKVMKDRPGVKFKNGKKNIILPSKL